MSQSLSGWCYNLIFQDLIILSVTSWFSVSTEAPYLDVIVNASRQDLITGVIECHSQHLVSILESVDRPFLTNVPQLLSSTDTRRKKICTWSDFLLNGDFSIRFQVYWLKSSNNPNPVIGIQCLIIYETTSSQVILFIQTKWQLELLPWPSHHRCRCRWAGVLGGPGSRC